MDERLVNLHEEILEKETLFDKEGEALLRSERALIYAEEKNFMAAAEDMKRVGEIAIEYGQTAHAAQAMMMRGNLLAADKETWTQATESYENSALLYEQVGESVLAAQAWRQVAGFYIWKKEEKTAVSTLQHAINLLDPETDADLLAQLYETYSRLSWTAGEYDEADRILQQAQNKLGDSPKIDELNQRQAILQGIIGGSLPMAQAWEMALPMLEPLGILDEALIDAIRAYSDEEWADVVNFAAESRQYAREDEDELAILRYVIASLLLADAQDKQNNRVSVLVALLTCRAVLMEEMGEEAAISVDNVLNSLGERWGDDGLKTAVSGYEDYVAENGRLEV